MSEPGRSGVKGILWPSGSGFYVPLLKWQGSINCYLTEINHSEMIKS